MFDHQRTFESDINLFRGETAAPSSAPWRAEDREELQCSTRREATPQDPWAALHMQTFEALPPGQAWTGPF